MDWEWLGWEEIDRDLLYAVLALRQRVFVVEQQCAYLDADGLDPQAMHLVGRRDRQVVACLRAFGPAQDGAARIGRVVTAAAVRGTGVGRALMIEGIARIEATWGRCVIRLSAQAHLARFYGSLGFVVCGPGYDEDGIPHLPMRR